MGSGPLPLDSFTRSTEQEVFVTDSGFPKLPATLVAKTLRGMWALPSFKRDKTKNTTLYCFELGNFVYDSPEPISGGGRDETSTN